MEQQECYGIPYTMAVHDIGVVHEVTGVYANGCLQRGEKLLAVNATGDTENGLEHWYVFGIPRQQECGVHAGVVKTYWHGTDVWMCPECSKPSKQD